VTYRELAQKILESSNENQLDSTVTVLIDGEFHPVYTYDWADQGCDVLDKYHPILVVEY
jgi:hypothetical protein